MLSNTFIIYLFSLISHSQMVYFPTIMRSTLLSSRWREYTIQEEETHKTNGLTAAAVYITHNTVKDYKVHPNTLYYEVD